MNSLITKSISGLLFFIDLYTTRTWFLGGYAHALAAAADHCCQAAGRRAVSACQLKRLCCLLSKSALSSDSLDLVA